VTTTETAAGPVADPPRWWRWLAMPVPLGRVAAFRVLIYAFVLGDILIFTGWVRNRVDVPTSEYQPLFIARHLPLPAPTPLVVRVVFWALLASAIVAALGWLPRIAGWVTFALYFEWLIVAMSYGKVDHDRFGLLVALAVLPTVGKARHGDERTSENAGWVLRFTQLACIATYFLSSWAKLRFGGIAWLTGATLTRAILRRGTDFGHLLLEIPHFGVISQFGIMAFELSSPLIFLARGRLRFAAVGGLFMFHLLVFLTISISFLAHLVAMTSFLPLERVRPVVRVRAWLGRAVQARSASLGNQR
jgi:hypothetical protein